MAGVSRFQKRGGQFQGIVRERYGDDDDAARELSIHARATAGRRAPQAPNNRFVSRPSLSGTKQAAKVPTRGGTSNPISNTKFV